MDTDTFILGTDAIRLIVLRGFTSQENGQIKRLTIKTETDPTIVLITLGWLIANQTQQIQVSKNETKPASGASLRNHDVTLRGGGRSSEKTKSRYGLGNFPLKNWPQGLTTRPQESYSVSLLTKIIPLKNNQQQPNLRVLLLKQKKDL